jgi:hypothetical protein
MAKQTTAAGYEPASEYRVELGRVVKFDGLRLRGEITLTGEAIERLIAQEGADIILSAEKL